MKRDPAFTLIEVLTVISIVAIILIIVFYGGPKSGEMREFVRNGHVYFEKREFNGRVYIWGTPVHDPDCAKCKEALK